MRPHVHSAQGRVVLSLDLNDRRSLMEPEVARNVAAELLQHAARCEALNRRRNGERQWFEEVGDLMADAKAAKAAKKAAS